MMRFFIWVVARDDNERFIHFTTKKDAVAFRKGLAEPHRWRIFKLMEPLK